MRSPMIKRINADRWWDKAQFAARGFVLILVLVAIYSWGANSDQEDAVVAAKPMPASLMGWKLKPTQEQTEQILEPTRRQVEALDRQIKEEMERRAKQ